MIISLAMTAVLCVITPVSAFSTRQFAAASRSSLSSIRHDEFSPEDFSANILTALRGTAGDKRLSLNLETDFYDSSTGLYSEGVWHNCLAGVASLQLQQPADRIADSLYKYSWDGCSFRRRAWSGNWDHSALQSLEGARPHQANYYHESSEHRCIQHGMALAFWSILLSHNKNNHVYREQHQEIALKFYEQFWDATVQKWTTVSRTQGGGTLLRPSASAGKTTAGATKPTPYYRAVDQAVALLACLEHLKVLEEDDGEAREQVVNLIQMTGRQLLSSFGYEHVAHAQSYLGMDRNRNFWHDGWTHLALICARPYLSLETHDQLETMWEHLLEMYGSTDGTVWHWACNQKASNVRYCGDNALAYAIRRKLALEQTSGFLQFVHELRAPNGLVSVADVYPQVRLHPNTELAALLLWPQ